LPIKIAIIGAGAAGCFAAANLSLQEGDTVALFEKTGKALQKVLVSGGGRCNVTNACTNVKDLLDKYPRGRALLQRTLHRFGTADTVQWFESRGLKLKAEPDGRMFPETDDSRSVIDCIWHAMQRNGVQVYYHRALERIESSPEGFILHFTDASPYKADKVLITTGGSSKQAAGGFLPLLGHTIIPPLPSLFTFNIHNNAITQLMGLAVPNATVKLVGTKLQQSGPVLITHWGLSGPAILRLSAFAAIDLASAKYNFKISINWVSPKTDADIKEEISYLRQTQGKQTVLSNKSFALPKRLWEFLCQYSGIDAATKWGELSASAQNKLCETLLRDTYQVIGKTTFKEEFVTCGGIDINEVDKQSMESKRIPGLYFAGEVLNVDGITGGFNFQHAWSSAYVAAQSITLR
jgi:predicted Rossmann fold flavoprotein